METLKNIDILKLAYWKLIDIKIEEEAKLKKYQTIKLIRKVKQLKMQIKEIEEEIIKVSKTEEANF